MKTTLQIEYSDHSMDGNKVVYLLSRWPSATEAREMESVGRTTKRQMAIIPNGQSPYVVWERF